MHRLDIWNTNKKLLSLHDNIFEIKVHFESKLILIQRLDKKDWIKLMYLEYIIYSFSTTIGPNVCGAWNITKQMKIQKLIQCPSIKSPSLWYGNGFLKRKYYYAFIVKQMKKTHILNGISSKNFQFLNDPRFNWCISIS